MPIFGLDVPFADHCGIEEIGVFEGATRLRVRAAPHHGNNHGTVHGGLICTLVDFALATAARVRLGRPVMTLDLHIAFIGPGSGPLVGEGRVIRAGRSILFCEGEVRREEDGSLVAKGSGIFKAVPDAKGKRGGAQNSV